MGLLLTKERPRIFLIRHFEQNSTLEGDMNLRIEIKMFLLVLCACLATGWRQEAPPAKGPLVTQSSLDFIVKRFPMFSGSIIVAQDGKIIAKAYVGFADKISGASIGAQTLFSVASVGKMFTAVAIIQLAESGKLGFDAPVVQVIPELAERIDEKVTIDHLLHHTSGIGRISEIDDDALDALQSNRDYFKLILASGIKSAGPAKFAYRNENFILLGEMVERIAGQSFESYIRAHIANPIGMVGPVYTRRDRAVSLQVAQPYLAVDFETWWNSEEPIKGKSAKDFVHKPPLVTPSAGGGPYARALDLFLFAAALRKGTLILPSSFAEMCEIVGSDEGSHRGYCRGCSVDVSEKGIRVGHTGSSAGVQARFFLYMNQHVDVIVLSNHDAQASPIFKAIEKLVYGE